MPESTEPGGEVHLFESFKHKTKKKKSSTETCIDAFTMIQTFYTNVKTLVEKCSRTKKNINKAVKSGI